MIDTDPSGNLCVPVQQQRAKTKIKATTTGSRPANTGISMEVGESGGDELPDNEDDPDHHLQREAASSKKIIRVHQSTVNRLNFKDKAILDELVRLGRAVVLSDTGYARDYGLFTPA